MKGKIEWFNRKEGYGAVSDEFGRHFKVIDGSFSKDLDGSWVDGQPVEFDLVESDGETYATITEPGLASIRLVFLDGVSDARINEFANLLSKVLGIELYQSVRQDREEIDPLITTSIEELIRR